ncbi:hypothetical protein Poly24_22800 [Rosistilla carotiformis]|uniref:Uncharacterized protein n=1 Tax=Rosistilla carotiformis TaxID=2528017 RepID=A0A518JSQ3_9BACT|nr:hypothetical protein Poly24_22800 [Rosistilla carotiformis]
MGSMVEEKETRVRTDWRFSGETSAAVPAYHIPVPPTKTASIVAGRLVDFTQSNDA